MAVIIKNEALQYLLLIVFVLNFTFAMPKPEDRVVEKVLSDKEHYVNEEHNKNYDHEAFLGEEAKTFDQFTPDESKLRLSLIVDKIDKDKDGFVTLEELKNWVEYTQTKYIVDDVDHQWKTTVPEGSDKLSWEQHRKLVFGFSHDSEADQVGKDDEGYSYKTILKKEKRKWNAADVDGDGSLTRDEYAAFLHPESADHMKDIVVLETIEDIDKDGDGKISSDEYIGDMYNIVDEDEQMPEWVRTEKEHFALFRDKNGDGFLDAEEVKNWILPGEFDNADAEARHLIHESDSNSDQKLTKEEILENYDLFVGSQATDFGEALVRHDEF